MKFSVVLPIHNEAEFLKYSLPSIYKLNPDEVILLFDRCNDNSLLIAKRISKISGKSNETKFITMNKSSPDWNNRIAYLRRYGFNLSSNDIILNTDADVVLDQNIVNIINRFNEKVALISFGYLDKPINPQTFLRRLISTLSPIKGYAGIYAISKKAWKATENNDVKKIHFGEDSFLRISILSKYNSRHFNTKSIHLRPDENKRRHYMRGVIYHEILKTKFPNILLQAIFCLRPTIIVGYRHSKNDIITSKMLRKRGIN